MLKYLRIAVTALSLTACVLLIALWVRSHGSSGDQINKSLTDLLSYRISSSEGVLILNVLDHNAPQWGFMPKFQNAGFLLQHNRKNFLVGTPYWFPVFLTAALSIAPWVKWSKRFSLRTLLIAITLVAVGLAGIVVGSR